TWKHRDKQSGRDIVRRGRELVVMSYACLDNYDYGFTWIFSEDGTLELQVGVTGIVLVKGVDRSACGNCAGIAAGRDADLGSSPDDRFGTLVDENLVAPNHQHFLNYRLDFDIDGADNTVVEMNAGPPPETATNPELNAFLVDEHVLRDEKEARRDGSPAPPRSWKVVSPSSRNALGHVRGYALVPGAETAVPYMGPKATVRRQAGFMERQLFVTRYRPGEMAAAGSFPDGIAGANGLPRWTADAESIVGTD